MKNSVMLVVISLLVSSVYLLVDIVIVNEKKSENSV